MKKYFIGLMAVTFALIATVAFTPTKSVSKNVFDTSLFVLDEGTTVDPKVPGNYQPFSGDPDEACPGTGKICIIEVRIPTDVYQTGPNAGKPKVDVPPLSSEIDAALASANDPYVAPGTGNKYWKRN